MGVWRSSIWQFRCRAGEYLQTNPHNSRDSADKVLCDNLKDWRNELVSGTDLGQTDFEKLYEAHVYKHGQKPNAPKVEGENDHYSPVKPVFYIEHRLMPMMKFYQTRLPGYARRKTFLNIMLNMASAVASLLAYLV